MKAKTDISNCLATTHPEIAAQWHPIKNGSLMPSDVVAGSNKLVCWKCPVAEDHEWMTRIVERLESGCPCCSKPIRKIVLSNCLATTHPEITREWHPIKNGNLAPFDVVAGSRKKVWWNCPVAEDHEWDAQIYNRVGRGSGCPFCSNDRVSISNCLAATHPELAKQWHPTKNDITPFNVTAGTSVKFWWLCPVAEDHEWQAIVISRTHGFKVGCPCCAGKVIVKSNSLQTLFPEVAEEWHPFKNGSLTPNDVGIATHKYGKIWWVGKCGHEWDAHIDQRIRGSGCPVCCDPRGEVAIKKYLDAMDIKYKTQVRFKSCKHIHTLPFDFIIDQPVGMKAIEFNGRQHYEYVSRFHRKGNDLATVQRRDKIKVEWCKEKGLPLLVVPHWELKNVSKLLEEFLESSLVNNKAKEVIS
jgi:hypothetical protein